MGIQSNELSANAKGGTELMTDFLKQNVPAELLDKFQIVPSRIGELDESKVRIFYAHDLPGDPGAEPLKDGGWQRFHRLVFVSYWQRQSYVNHYNIPYSKTTVLHNTIKPIPRIITDVPPETIRLIYHPTPHRGLNILVHVFEKLAEEYDNVHLDVYSSFKLYGWESRDKDFKALYDLIENHPKMTYHGTVDNEVIREALTKSHIFAYPSIWPETSCICLMEAMSAGLVCVHPDFAALPETAANMTWMYNFHENVNDHARIFYQVLKEAIEAVQKSGLGEKSKMGQTYANLFYGHDLRLQQWLTFLRAIENEPTAFPTEPIGPVFEYRR